MKLREKFHRGNFDSLAPGPSVKTGARVRHFRGCNKDDIVTANRVALKAEASARLERLQFKKDEHIRLCNVRCGKYNEYIKIEPCRSLVALAALCAQHGTDLRACAEALRDQIRVRVHV